MYIDLGGSKAGQKAAAIEEPGRNGGIVGII